MPRPLPLRIAAIAAIAALTAGCPKDEEEAARAEALAGEWRVSVVRAGTGVASGTLPGWIRARFTVAADGSVVVHEVLDALGGTGLPAVLPTYACAGDGAVTMVEGPLTEYLGQLDPGGDLWLATGSDATTSHLRISERRPAGTTYAQGDLAGSWHYHAFEVGAFVRFEHGRATVTADGTTTLTSRVASTEGALDDLEIGKLLVAAGGTVAPEGDADPSWEGTLSAGKDLLVATHTPPSSGHEYELILISRLPAGVDTADLAGSWKVFVLDQDGEGGGWSRTTATVASDGTVTLSSWEDSHGGAVPGDSIQLSVGADGVLSQVGGDRWHGAVSPGGDAWFAVTDRDEGTSASVFLAVRR